MEQLLQDQAEVTNAIMAKTRELNQLVVKLGKVSQSIHNAGHVSVNPEYRLSGFPAYIATWRRIWKEDPTLVQMRKELGELRAFLKLLGTLVTLEPLPLGHPQRKTTSSQVA